jgi:hypothetical protein
LNAHITNAKRTQDKEKIDNLQYVYSQLRKYNNVLADIRKISSFYEKSAKPHIGIKDSESREQGQTVSGIRINVFSQIRMKW